MCVIIFALNRIGLPGRSNRRHRIFGGRNSLVLTGVLLLVFFHPAARAESQSVATVNPRSVVVTNFEGWGTSLCWWAKVVGGYTNRDDYMALAFSALKLNLVRYNIGGGENPGIANTLPFRARRSEERRVGKECRSR